MSLSRLILHNWQVKVVAFFLAVALWLYTSEQARLERTVIVRVPDSAVHSLPADYQITAITPREFSVDLEGPSTLLGDLGLDVLVPTLVVPADALGEGKHPFSITERILGLPVDVRVKRIQPENINSITVSFGRIVEEHLPVEVPELVPEPAGVKVSWGLDKDMVRVRGPQDVIADLKQRGEKLRFDPVSSTSFAAQLNEITTLRLQLSPQPIANTIVLDAVNATITLEPRVTTKQAANVTVNLLVPPDFPQLYRVELSQSQVAINVHGPMNLLQELQPTKDLTAYLNLLRGFEPDVTKEVKLSVIGPAWATFDDATVRYTVRVLAPRVAPAPEQPEEVPSPPIDH